MRSLIMVYLKIYFIFLTFLVEIQEIFTFFGNIYLVVNGRKSIFIADLNSKTIKPVTISSPGSPLHFRTLHNMSSRFRMILNFDNKERTILYPNAKMGDLTTCNRIRFGFPAAWGAYILDQLNFLGISQNGQFSIFNTRSLKIVRAGYLDGFSKDSEQLRVTCTGLFELDGKEEDTRMLVYRSATDESKYSSIDDYKIVKNENDGIWDLELISRYQNTTGMKLYKMKYLQRENKHYIVASRFNKVNSGVYIFQLKGNFCEKIELVKEVIVKERGIYSLYMDCIGNQIWYTCDTETKGIVRISII